MSMLWLSQMEMALNLGIHRLSQVQSAFVTREVASAAMKVIMNMSPS